MSTTKSGKKAYIIFDTDDCETIGVVVASNKRTAAKILIDSFKDDIANGWLTNSIILSKYSLNETELLMEE